MAKRRSPIDSEQKSGRFTGDSSEGDAWTDALRGKKTESESNEKEETEEETEKQSPEGL